MVNSTPALSSISTPASYPESIKRYLQANRADLRVPYREVVLSATHHSSYLEDNPPIPIYDTSGPYTDPEIGMTSIADCRLCAALASRNETIPRYSRGELPNTPVGGKVICSPRICVFPGGSNLAEHKSAGT